MIGAADADNRDLDVGQQSLDFRVVIISNDAVAQPLPDVLDTRPEILFNEDIPFLLRCL
jgi:hypothetical protein